MAGDRAEALRGSQALQELSWKQGSLVPLSEVNQGSGVQFTTRKAFRALCQKD